MKKVNCVIVDDEPHAIELLDSYLKKIVEAQIVFKSVNPIEALSFVNRNPDALLFLDIHMPELNGLQFLKLLNKQTSVILTTAYAQHALEGYEHNVIDYLVKPISFERFLKGFQKALHFIQPDESGHKVENILENKDSFILVKTDTKGKLVKLKHMDIHYIEALGNYVQIFTKDAKVISLLTIKDLEANLPSSLFIRVHKSFIISTVHLDLIEGSWITIGKNKIPIGESYKEKLMERLSEFLFQKKK